MTDVLSVLFGKKKTKGPAPPVPQETISSDFVIVDNNLSGQTTQSNNTNNNVYDNLTGSHEYESLFSFLKENPKGELDKMSISGGYRPIRPAPPVPVPFGGGPYSLNPSSSYSPAAETSADSSNSSYYLKGVPFQVSATLGGGMDLRQLRSELSERLGQLRKPDVNDFEYQFGLEEQVIREAQAKSHYFE